jgi:hypothetical protein
MLILCIKLKGDYEISSRAIHGEAGSRFRKLVIGFPVLVLILALVFGCASASIPAVEDPSGFNPIEAARPIAFSEPLPQLSVVSTSNIVGDRARQVGAQQIEVFSGRSG